MATPSYDPVFLNARREALLILLAWFVCLLWTVGYCAFAGYNVPPEEISVILGMPAWVFWGVFIPWIGATLFSVWFGLFYIVEEEPEEYGEDA